MGSLCFSNNNNIINDNSAIRIDYSLSPIKNHHTTNNTVLPKTLKKHIQNRKTSKLPATIKPTTSTITNIQKLQSKKNVLNMILKRMTSTNTHKNNLHLPSSTTKMSNIPTGSTSHSIITRAANNTDELSHTSSSPFKIMPYAIKLDAISHGTSCKIDINDVKFARSDPHPLLDEEEIADICDNNIANSFLPSICPENEPLPRLKLRDIKSCRPPIIMWQNIPTPMNDNCCEKYNENDINMNYTPNNNKIKDISKDFSFHTNSNSIPVNMNNISKKLNRLSSFRKSSNFFSPSPLTSRNISRKSCPNMLKKQSFTNNDEKFEDIVSNNSGIDPFLLPQKRVLFVSLIQLIRSYDNGIPQFILNNAIFVFGFKRGCLLPQNDADREEAKTHWLISHANLSPDLINTLEIKDKEGHIFWIVPCDDEIETNLHWESLSLQLEQIQDISDYPFPPTMENMITGFSKKVDILPSIDDDGSAEEKKQLIVNTQNLCLNLNMSDTTADMTPIPRSFIDSIPPTICLTNKPKLLIIDSNPVIKKYNRSRQQLSISDVLLNGEIDPHGDIDGTVFLDNSPTTDFIDDENSDFFSSNNIYMKYLNVIENEESESKEESINSDYNDNVRSFLPLQQKISQSRTKRNKRIAYVYRNYEPLQLDINWWMKVYEPCRRRQHNQEIRHLADYADIKSSTKSFSYPAYANMATESQFNVLSKEILAQLLHTQNINYKAIMEIFFQSNPNCFIPMTYFSMAEYVQGHMCQTFTSLRTLCLTKYRTMISEFEIADVFQMQANSETFSKTNIISDEHESFVKSTTLPFVNKSKNNVSKLLQLPFNNMLMSNSDKKQNAGLSLSNTGLSFSDLESEIIDDDEDLFNVEDGVVFVGLYNAEEMSMEDDEYWAQSYAHAGQTLSNSYSNSQTIMFNIVNSGRPNIMFNDSSLPPVYIQHSAENTMSDGQPCTLLPNQGRLNANDSSLPAYIDHSVIRSSKTVSQFQLSILC